MPGRLARELLAVPRHSREPGGTGDGRRTAASGLVHELHAGRMGPPAGRRRISLGRPVLRRHGAGAGARVLRLHHDRGHADGVRSLRRQRRGRAEARTPGAEARSGAARRTDRRGDHAPGCRRHDVDPGLSAVHAGTALLDAGPHRRRPFRLEHRHLRRGHRGTEFRPRQAAAARTTLRDGRRIRRPGVQAVRLVGSGRGGDGPREWHLCRLPPRPADPFRGQVFQGPRSAEHRALAAGQAGVRAGRRLAARQGLRREARRTRSLPPPTASMA